MATARVRGLVTSLVVGVLGLAVVVPASAVAAETVQPAPPLAAEPEPAEPVSDPSEAAEPGPTESSDEEPATEEPSTTDEPTPADDPTPDNEPTRAVAAEQALAADFPVFAESVVICHRTNDPTNPYNQQRVAFPQAEGHALNHTGPIFAPGGPRPWGDIIPPNPAVPNGKNWPAGRPILENGCEVEPDPGPLPSATIGQLVCTGAVPSIDVTVSNDADATAPASFTIVVDGDAVLTAGPVAPGDSETVTLTGPDLVALEDQTVTIDVLSDGSVVASSVVTIDCVPAPADVQLLAQLDCTADGAVGTLEVTNNGADPVTVTVTVNGEDFASPLEVGAGATETGSADFSQFEDQTITVQVLVDGDPVATYQPTPDCEHTAVPQVAVGSLECPTATVTLSNAGDPESTVVFTILVNGQVTQESAPLFGGDTTTIVGDLQPYEDQTVTIALRANGELLGSRTIHVDCRQAPGTGPGAGQGGPGTAPAVDTGAGGPPVPVSVDAGQRGPGTAVVGAGADGTILPGTSAPFTLWMLALGLVLIAGGAFRALRRQA